MEQQTFVQVKHNLKIQDFMAFSTVLLNTSASYCNSLSCDFIETEVWSLYSKIFFHYQHYKSLEGCVCGNEHCNDTFYSTEYDRVVNTRNSYEFPFCKTTEDPVSLHFAPEDFSSYLTDECGVTESGINDDRGQHSCVENVYTFSNGEEINTFTLKSGQISHWRISTDGKVRVTLGKTMTTRLIGNLRPWMLPPIGIT